MLRTYLPPRGASAERSGSGGAGRESVDGRHDHQWGRLDVQRGWRGVPAAHGRVSERYSWSKFSQDALKELAQDPKAKDFAEPFIEIPPEARPRPQPKPVVLKDVTRVELPAGRTRFFSSFTAPMGLLILAVLYTANLLAAYEIARFRNRPVAVVCGLAALLPWSAR
jgi:hypothetical protein